MGYAALAADYDGTLASEGRVAPEVLLALQAVRASGLRLVLVTGRQLDDLRAVFPDHHLFDRIVAENGAVLFDPSTGARRLLGAPPPAALTARLAERGVSPLSTGSVIVATSAPHAATAARAVADEGLAWQVILNKGSLMLLPAGVDKASGLRAALEELSLDAASVVAVGDAENDAPLLLLCGLGVAVADAVPELRERAGRVTAAANGQGVVELCEWLLRGDQRR